MTSIRGEPGRAKAALRDLKLQIANGKFEICDLLFMRGEDSAHCFRYSGFAHSIVIMRE